MDYLRRHGPFEPHRLPLDEMEYTTLPAVAERPAGTDRCRGAGHAGRPVMTGAARRAN
jgi:fructose 1,6-bisphosphate aldolase/phosphatase